jgi:Co/Zn/Cd efflux system component
VLGVAFLLRRIQLERVARALNKRRRPGASLWQTVQASKDASVFTVFIEDTAALLGIVVAAAGIFLGHLFDNPYIDPAASVLIGLLLVGAASRWRARPAPAGGRKRRHGGRPALKRDLRDDPAIESVGQLMTMQLGPDDVLLTAAVRFKRGMRIDEVEAAIERLEGCCCWLCPSRAWPRHACCRPRVRRPRSP